VFCKRFNEYKLKRTNYNFHLSKINCELTIRLLSAFAFCLFTFLYLYCYQADVISYTQHILSNGKTHYNAFIGAILITIVALILQNIFALITKPKGCLNALTYIPSATLIAYLSNTSLSINKSFLYFLLVICLSLSFTWFILYFIKKIPQITQKITDIKSNFFRQLWVNILILTAIFFSIGLCGNGDAAFHYRLKLERLISSGDYKEALDIVSDPSKIRVSSPMLSAFVLSKENLLGENFFETISSGSSSMLLPMGKNRLLILPQDYIYKYIGIIPSHKMDAISYFLYANSYRKELKRTCDYLLIAYLLDKKLDAFCSALKSYYSINDSLPKHYREALILYAHLRVHPKIILTDNVMEADFEDFLEAKRKKSLTDRAELFNSYGGTYWYFYYK
jgi:hypothetical protein